MFVWGNKPNIRHVSVQFNASACDGHHARHPWKFQWHQTAGNHRLERQAFGASEARSQHGKSLYHSFSRDIRRDSIAARIPTDGYVIYLASCVIAVWSFIWFLTQPMSLILNTCHCCLLGGNKDYIIVGSDSGRISIMEYVAAKNTFEKVTCCFDIWNGFRYECNCSSW